MNKMKNVFIQKADLKQNLKISPETALFLSMLQMNNFQLESYINDEIEQNPVLDFETADFSRDNINWREYFKKQRVYNSVNYENQESESGYGEAPDKSSESFDEHLIEQLYTVDLSESEFKISVNMIRDLNDKGYLDYTIEELADMYNIKEKEVESLLEKLKTLEPKGSFAYDMIECLVMQLDKSDSDYELAKNIIETNLEDIAAHRYTEIMNQYGIDEKKLDEVIKEIKALNPIPSSGFSSGSIDETDYILPEIFLKVEGDGFKIEIPDTKYTRLNVNEGYLSVLKGNKDDEAEEYINNSLNRARLLLKNIESRKNTIKKISEEIVKKQSSFLFDRGVLASLNQSEIADIVDVSVSTVSRAIDNKYIDTPRGVFSMKYFFSNKLVGDAESSTEAVKKEIKSIIDLEETNKPLSDQKIKEALEEKGIDVSRRTVSKYREELGIPNSSQRKRIEKFSEGKKSLQ